MGAPGRGQGSRTAVCIIRNAELTPGAKPLHASLCPRAQKKVVEARHRPLIHTNREAQ
jgi:hypothetical protein